MPLSQMRRVTKLLSYILGGKQRSMAAKNGVREAKSLGTSVHDTLNSANGTE